MNKVILLSFLFALPIFAQKTDPTILALESEIKNSPVQKNDSVPFQEEQTGKKNVGLAILYSLLLPGMGELYAGDYSTGKYFTIADGILWGTYIGINSYGNWMQDRYVSYANSTGGSNTDGKDDIYFATIGEYSNIEQYNNQMALDRNFNEMYNEETHYWKWNTETERKSYRNMWVSSEESFNSLRFVVGALIVNRVASAINAVRLTAAYNKKQNVQTGWNVSVGMVNGHPGIPSGLSLNFNKSF